ncbi:hypothetical protein CCACVL1_01509 [Corchorus capsularis]|uniref:At1g61320/AtMIF1 LRR domain-containing protein n=1 Tax=Corchorus capsularis TaxID=210143 RepID=A0A1R3KHL0_COCAP|nr:hypothetical protein CCACVL1_01509 [Corchorus capsularis]
MDDRISELPLPIIHQIMSYLSKKEVDQTNSLSKTWKNNLRPSFPILAFNHEDFTPKEGEFHWTYLQRSYWGRPGKYTESMNDFTRHVEATLVNFCKCETNFKMLKFELYIGIYYNNFENWSALVNQWIKLALESQLDHPNPNPDNAAAPFNFQSLEILVLIEVCLDELMIHKLTSDSPMLNYIAMWDCKGFEHCHLPKLERLKTLIIDFRLAFSLGQVLNTIEVEAPNLEYCTIDCTRMVGPSSISSLFNCHHVRELSLSGNLITDQVLDSLFSIIFPLLEEFKLENSNILRRINISSQRLKQLKILNCQGLEAIHIDTPNLHGFRFVGNLVPIASIKAPCPGKFTAIMERRRVNTLWYLNLKKLLMGNAKHEELLTSRILLREKLTLGVFKIPESEYEAVLDAHLSICYPKTLCLFINGASVHGVNRVQVQRADGFCMVKNLQYLLIICNKGKFLKLIIYVIINLAAVPLPDPVPQRSISLRLQLCPLLEALLEKDYKDNNYQVPVATRGGLGS